MKKEYEKPLDCPFCGAKPLEKDGEGMPWEYLNIKKGSYLVRHLKGCMLGDLFIGGCIVLEKKLIKKWNRRAT